ncbi:MAG: alkaline phosphatase D family protein [Halieaceae bacterium]|jgi:alkaline phosphatase D|nr:alkaline phosphatase D family protein [Halieaceae bacterium]
MSLRRRHFLRYSLALAGSVYVSTRLTGCALNRNAPDLGEASFTHGVASGDPEATAIILWTRAQSSSLGAPVRIGWELAEDSAFTRIVRSGLADAEADRDYTVKVDVRELEPGRSYFYRFLSADGASPTGRTNTLPEGRVEELRLAVFSCSNYPAGYFHAYGEAARRSDLDAFVHLGDYFYEYGAGGYATERAVELGRDFPADNRGEIYTLDDYRRRYAWYRSDADLQALHAAAPMISVWDDHEIANDAWREGAENHSEDEGDYEARKAAALRAYFEWMPLRPLRPDTAGRSYRSFAFGDLVDLHMLDTRLIGRDQQLAYASYFDRDSKQLDAAAFTRDITAPDRSLLGEEQRAWLYAALETSQARWQVLGQQVLMARMTMPAAMLSRLFADRDLAATGPLIEELVTDKMALAAGEALADERLQRLRAQLPYNLDAWDGYPAERERLYAVARRLDKELVVLAGDTHNAWYSELRDRSGKRVGLELGTSSVSSPGMESYLSLGEKEARDLERALVALIDELQYCELRSRGYLDVTFTRSTLTPQWHFVDTVTDKSYSVRSTARTVRA